MHLKYSPKQTQANMPAFILKTPENDSFKSETWKWEDSIQKIAGGDLNGRNYIILQEYIPQKQPITSYRVVYNTCNPNIAPYGVSRTKTNFNKSDKQIVTYAYHDFTYATMSESAIKPFIHQMASLHNFLKLVIV